MRPLSRFEVEIVALLSFLTASVLAAPLRADDLADKAHVEAPVPKKPGRTNKAIRAEPKRADTAAARPGVDSLIGPSAASSKNGPDLAGPAAGSSDAWTLSPKWSASSGGNSVPYGTRALVNELQANPSETTGYGAGAEVNFHF